MIKKLAKLTNHQAVQLIMGILFLGLIGASIELLPSSETIGAIIVHDVGSSKKMRMTLENDMTLSEINQAIQNFQPGHRILANQLDDMGIIIINGRAQTPNGLPVSIIVHRTGEGKIKLSKERLSSGWNQIV